MSLKRKNLLALSLSHGAMHGYLVVLPALLPLIKKEFGNYFILGLMVSIVFFIYGWGSLPVGVIADHWFRKKAIILSMLLCGVASFFVALVCNLFLIMIALMILGIGTALYHPVGFSYIAFAAEKNRGRWIGIHGLAGNMGMAIGFVTSTSIGYWIGWRRTFLVWAGIGAIIAIIDLIILDEQTGKKKDKNEKIQENLLDYFYSLKKFFSSGMSITIIITVLVLIICSGALWNGVSAFLVAYINDVKRTPLILAGGLATISYTVGSLAQVFGGEISDRYGRISVLVGGFGLFAILLLVFTLPFVRGIVSIIFFVSLLGFSFFVTQPSLTALIADISPSNTVGFMYGMNFAIKYGVGGISPVLAGFIVDKYSMTAVFYFFSLISVIAFIFCFKLRTKNDKSTFFF